MKKRSIRNGATALSCAGALLAVCGCGIVVPNPDPDPIPSTVPDFDAATFSNPSVIDNVFFPQVPGAKLTYRAETEDGTEDIIIDVLVETRVVMGIDCRVVRDRVFVDGVLIEDTHDWYAQDDEGNVWYMGEEVDNYEYDNQGNLLEINNDGAFESGLDVADLGVIAKPGYVMKANPMVGDIYHQEYYPGEAEDMGEVIALNVEVTLSDGTMYICLQTRDINPLEPDSVEFKYYAPGIGVVLEEELEDDERVELISIE